jgi:hypothetical protein
MKACTSCSGNLADFVTVCPYCGAAQAVVQSLPQGGWVAPPKNSALAIVSLVCGVLFFFWPITALAAVVLGHVALSEIKKSAGRLAGQGLAVAGLVTGYIGMALGALFLTAFVIGIRSALRQNVPANETSAVVTMQQFNQALAAYKDKCPSEGYPAALARMGPGKGDCAHANLVDARLAIARPVRLGYQFVYTPGVNGTQKVTVFALVARPIQPGMTGKRYFFLDESGVVRQADSAVIGPNSPPVDDGNASDNDDDSDEPAAPPKEQSKPNQHH